MRYIVLALALCCSLAPVSAVAANRPTRRTRFKQHKPKKIKKHSHR